MKRSAINMKTGIAIVGSIIVDRINEIPVYPSVGKLAQIKSVSKSVGGLVPNVSIDLKRINPSLTVKAVGKIGNDEDGKFVKNVLAENGVDVNGVITCNDKTSFTEVMSITGGQRTFFCFSGANANFGVADVDFTTLNTKMLHLGYFLLLDKIDSGDGEKLLKIAKESGVKTSIDLVSENSNRYSLVLPCLKYVDNLIVNEIEAGALVGVEPNSENLTEIAVKLKNLGVIERVIIHTPSEAICASNSGVTKVKSYKLPKNFIVGTTGAGDAFCAGALLGIYNEKTDLEIIEFAQAVAVSSLTKADATSGVLSEAEIINLCKNLNRE